MSPVRFVQDSEGIQFLQWCLPRLGLRWPGFRKVRKRVYKRVARRIQELGLSSLSAYRAYLDTRAGEWVVLDGFCRIPISRFYRDRGVFQYLEEEVLPELGALAAHRGETELKCWSIGCAAGEESYTLAIVWRLGPASACPISRCAFWPPISIPRISRARGAAATREAASRTCRRPISNRPSSRRLRSGAWARHTGPA